MNIRMVVRSLAIVSVAYAIAAGAAESPAPATAPPAVEKTDPKALVLELQKDVAALRGGGRPCERVVPLNGERATGLRLGDQLA